MARLQIGAGGQISITVHHDLNDADILEGCEHMAALEFIDDEAECAMLLTPAECCSLADALAKVSAECVAATEKMRVRA